MLYYPIFLPESMMVGLLWTHLVNLDDEPMTITSITFQAIAWIPKYHIGIITAEGHPFSAHRVHPKPACSLKEC